MSPTRLFLVRLAFVLGCVLPTLYVVGWSVQHASPRYWAAQQTDWEERLSQHLGLSVKVESVAYPTIYLARLRGVRLMDPETKAEVARVRLVEIWHDDDGWQVELSQPEMELSALSSAWKQIHERLFRQAEVNAACQVTANELTLHGNADSQTLVEIKAGWEPTEAGPRLHLSGYLAGLPGPKAIALTISRDRSLSPPITAWQLDTGGVALPCLPAAGDLPLLAALGKDCKFAGQVQVELTEQGWQGNLQGKFVPVDLDTLVTEHLPHKLSGQAEIQVDKCQFAGGRVTLLRGTIESKGGYIGRSLLDSVVAHLAMQEDGVRPASFNPQAPVRFQRMAFGYELSSEGLTLRGADGVLITAAAHPILLEPAEKQLAPARLLRALSAADDQQSLASPSLEALRSALPLPSSLAPAPKATKISLPGSDTGGKAVREPGTSR